MRHPCLAAICLLALAFVAPGHAAELPEEIGRAGGGASLDRPVSALQGAQIVAARDGSSASIKIARVVSGLVKEDAGKASIRFSTWSVVVATPLNKNANDTDIATLDGLGNGTSIELGLGRFTAGGVRRARLTPEQLTALDAICARVRKGMEQQGAKAEPGKECDREEVAQYDNEDLFAYDAHFWTTQDQRNWVWGGSAKVASLDLEYLDKNDLTRTSQHAKPWSLGGFIAYNPDDVLTVITLSAKYQKSFKNQKSATLCPLPVPGGAYVTCATGALGAPDKVTGKLLSIEVRRQFAEFGMGVILTRDFGERVTGIELPVYLVKDKEGKLTAGLKSGWRSDTDKLTFGVFVGVPFSLFR